MPFFSLLFFPSLRKKKRITRGGQLSFSRRHTILTGPRDRFVRKFFLFCESRPFSRICQCAPKQTTCFVGFFSFFFSCPRPFHCSDHSTNSSVPGAFDRRPPFAADTRRPISEEGSESGVGPDGSPSSLAVPCYRLACKSRRKGRDG